MIWYKYEVRGLRIADFKYVLNFVSTDYKSAPSGDNLDGIGEGSNWVQEEFSKHVEAAEQGIMDGFAVGALDYFVEGGATYLIGKLTGVAKLARTNPMLAASILKAEKTVANLANKIADANPQILKAVEKIIKKDGKTLTDFDIETDKFIIEVAGGGGKGKASQILNKIKPNAGGKEVILFGPNLKQSVKKQLEKDGIKFFDNADDLIKHITKE